MDREFFGDILEILEVFIFFKELLIMDVCFEEFVYWYCVKIDGGFDYLVVWYLYNFIEKKNYVFIKFCY